MVESFTLTQCHAQSNQTSKKSIFEEWSFRSVVYTSLWSKWTVPPRLPPLSLSTPVTLGLESVTPWVPVQTGLFPRDASPV